MFHQNSIGMPERIEKWGCYSTVIAGLKASWTRKPVFKDQFIRVVENAESLKFLIEDPDEPGTFMYVRDPEGIFFLLGLRVQYRGKLPPSYRCKPDELEALLWRRPENGRFIYHFTAGNGRSLTTYDPWAPFSLTASIGELRSKRVFKVLGEV